MLEVDDVRFRYPGGPEFLYALSIARGEVVTLAGPSGSGKSTLIDLICGFLQPLAGDILWERRSILHLGPAARPVSALFQTGDLFEHLDVETNILLGLDPRARRRPEHLATVRAVLAEMDLAGFEHRMPPSLSGGQRQRVALARALVRERPVMLLDEPFTALDPATRDELAALVRRLTDARALATLVVSHDPADARRLAARALVLRGGRIEAEKPRRTERAGDAP